jgi:hypothetical protein
MELLITMHPEDDPKMDDLLNAMEEQIEKDKKRLKEAKYQTDVLKEALKLIEIPDNFRKVVDAFFMIAEGVGTNQARINELQYLVFVSMRGIDRQLSDIYDRLTGLDKHR